MLSCPQHHFAPPTSLHRHPHRLPIATAISAQHHTPTPDPAFRTHNSKSTSLLLRHLSPHSQQHDINSNNNSRSKNQHFTVPTQEDNHHLQPESPNQNQSTKRQLSVPLQEKLNIVDISLASKRTPRFPGSIYATSVPPVQSLFHSRDDNEGEKNNIDDDHDEEEMIMRALAIRRKVTQEIFKEAMRKGKFGITYSTNLTDRLPEYIDYVMIEAAALKTLPEFRQSTFNHRVKTVIEDCSVVSLVRWLKHNGVSYPKIGKLICMSKGNLGSIRRLADWLKSIHVKGEFLGVVLLKSGDNILQRSLEELNEIVDYLESNGVRRDWMGYVMSRCPPLLSYSMEEMRSRVEFYLSMGMNEKDFGTMVFDYPRILGQYTLEEMNRKVNYLKEFGVSTEDVGRLLAFRPHLMGCSIEERWKPLVKYLYYLGISREGMRRMLIIKPMIFCFDLEITIVPKVKFFKDIGIRDDGISNMLVKFPPLLTYSLYKKIRPVVIFLMTKAGVNEKDIGKVIALGPELLGCSISKRLEVNVKYFLSLGIRPRQLGEMIADFPMLLRYKVDLLRPKYKYLRRVMVRPLQEVIEFPRFFSYSLDDRIIPRHKIMVENSVNFKLRYMLACTDERFSEKLREKVERRLRFESGLVDDDLVDRQTDDGSTEQGRVLDFPESEDEFSDSESCDYSTERVELDASRREDSQLSL